MKSTDLEKRVSAYLDGALAEARRDRLERELEQDPGLRKQLDRSRALAQLVREAWTEGPPAPAPDVLLAALRPQLAAISRERRARPAWLQTLEQARIRLSGWFGPMPLATSAALAFVLALAFLPRPSGGPIPGLSAVLPAQGEAALQSAPMPGAATPSTYSGRPTSSFAPANLLRDPAAGVYDVSPRETPAMIFQNPDGSTLLWLLENDDLSRRFERLDRWS